MNTLARLTKDFLWFMIPVALLGFAGKASAQVLPEYSAFPKSSIGVQLGTQGLGLQGSVSFAKSFNITAGFITIPGINVLYNSRNLQVDRNAIFAIADWQPKYGNTDWLSRKWFVSAGFGYYFNNTLHREGIGATPNYSVYMSKFRPYIGTGLGNIYLYNNIGLRLDFGDYLPTSKPVSTYENKAQTITNGLKSIGPGLNMAATVYIKF